MKVISKIPYVVLAISLVPFTIKLLDRDVEDITEPFGLVARQTDAKLPDSTVAEELSVSIDHIKLPPLSEQGELTATIETRKRAPMSKDDMTFVCRAAIGAIMGRPISIIRATTSLETVVNTEYLRPSDGSLWENACKIEGEKVLWASFENGRRGRWRTDSQDEEILFKLDPGAVTIVQVYSDGSASMDVFERE